MEVEETEGGGEGGWGNKRDAAAKRPEEGEGSETHRGRARGQWTGLGAAGWELARDPHLKGQGVRQTDRRSHRQTDTRQTARQSGDREGALEPERPDSQTQRGTEAERAKAGKGRGGEREEGGREEEEGRGEKGKESRGEEEGCRQQEQQQQQQQRGRSL